MLETLEKEIKRDPSAVEIDARRREILIPTGEATESQGLTQEERLKLGIPDDNDIPFPDVDETLLDNERVVAQPEQSAKLIAVYEKVIAAANASNNTIAVAKYKKFIEWARQGMTHEEILAKENEQVTQMKEEAVMEKEVITKLERTEEVKSGSSSLWSKMKRGLGLKR